MGGNTSELNNTQWKELVSDKLFHAVLNHMPDALHCCNSGEGYSFLWMSDGFCGLTGYSREELIAELGAAFLVNHAGLETTGSFRNSAGYIQSWLKKLKNDKRLIVTTAGKADKAVAMILNKSEDMDDGR